MENPLNMIDFYTASYSTMAKWKYTRKSFYQKRLPRKIKKGLKKFMKKSEPKSRHKHFRFIKLTTSYCYK